MDTGYNVFGVSTPTRVHALAARNLQLLQAIESTISRLDSDSELLHAIQSAFEEVLGSLQTKGATQAIDPEGATCVAMAQASDACVRMHRTAKARHHAACNDCELTSEDGVAEAYDAYLLALEGVHDSIEELKEWIATHDALLDSSLPGTFGSVDDLFAAMGVKIP